MKFFSSLVWSIAGIHFNIGQGMAKDLYKVEHSDKNLKTKAIGGGGVFDFLILKFG